MDQTPSSRIIDLLKFYQFEDAVDISAEVLGNLLKNKLVEQKYFSTEEEVTLFFVDYDDYDEGLLNLEKREEILEKTRELYRIIYRLDRIKKSGDWNALENWYEEVNGLLERYKLGNFAELERELREVGMEIREMRESQGKVIKH